MSVPRPYHKFKIDQYERMFEIGVLSDRHRVELIRGEILDKGPTGDLHDLRVGRAVRACEQQLDDSHLILVRRPIWIAPDGEPAPDVSLVRRGHDESAAPSIADVVLLIEVAHETIELDRGTKLPLYAEAGVPEAWLVDLIAYRLERHADPHDRGYRSVATAERGAQLRSTVVPDLLFDAADLLGFDADAD